jgi:hypothetical protein
MSVSRAKNASPPTGMSKKNAKQSPPGSLRPHVATRHPSETDAFLPQRRASALTLLQHHAALNTAAFLCTTHPIPQDECDDDVVLSGGGGDVHPRLLCDGLPNSIDSSAAKDFNTFAR